MLYFCKLLLRIFSIVIMFHPRTHFGWNIYTQCDLAGKRNYIFYTLRYSFKVADPSNLKFLNPEGVVLTLSSKRCEPGNIVNLDFSP